MKPVKKCFLIFDIILLLILAGSCSSSKHTTTSLLDKGKLVFVDQSDNGYVLRGQRSLVKYDFRNHPTERFDFDLSIHGAGLSTDLRIFAYNPDFQTFYILDKYLNVISKFAFNEYFDFLVELPVLANGQSIWLYNPTENKIQRYTTQLEFLDETRNLNWEIPGVRVDQLIFHRNDIYLVDHRKGIFIFDFAGRLKQRFPLPALSRDIQIDQSMSLIYAYFSNQWHRIDPDENPTGYEPLDLPLQSGHNADDNLIFENGKAYLWNTSLQKVEEIELRESFRNIH